MIGSSSMSPKSQAPQEQKDVGSRPAPILLSSNPHRAKSQLNHSLQIVEIRPPESSAALPMHSQDYVKLSAPAEATALRQLGFTPSEIADRLNVSLQTVDAYLKISETPVSTGKALMASAPGTHTKPA